MMPGKKRKSPEMLDSLNNQGEEPYYDEYAAQSNKRFRYAEDFEDINDIFALEH